MDAIGLLGDRKQRVLEQLQQGPATAQALADKFGCQVTAVRGHLDGLEAQGLVLARFRREGVGRPRKVYELTDAGQEVFPRRYHLFLTRLIERIVAKEGRAYAARMLVEVAREMAEELHVPRDGPVQQRAEALAEALHKMGFDAAIQQTEEGLVLVRKNCIFLDAAREHHDLVCGRFDQELVRAAFGSDAKLGSCMAKGESCCNNVLVPTGGSPS
jgi:predicted ArsR family transcriptional regulator